MPEPRVMQITEEYAPPTGTLGLGSSGRLPDRFERLTVYTTDPLSNILNRILAEHQGLLGPGELVFATSNVQGEPARAPDGTPCTAYIGYILFVPEGLTLEQPEIPPETPDKVAEFVKSHWGDFRKMALAVGPDHVLIAWLDQQTFAVQAIERTKLIEAEPDSVPDPIKQGPLPLESGADATVWLALCSHVEQGVSFAWCAVSFYPEG